MKHPELSPVDSTVIAGSHYDPSSRVLTLKFTKGDTWQYHEVPIERAEALSGSASPGRFFGERIRGQYNGRKL